MQLLVGLGNPGAEYADTRHNIGHLAVREIAERHGIKPWRKDFHGWVTRGTISGVKVLLLLPATYMNESGQAVVEAAHFLKIAPADVTVFHDDIYLPRAKVRVKTGGTDAGHNGLRSISQRIGFEYRRVRIGVGHPESKELMEQYVLGHFAKRELKWVVAILNVIADNANFLIENQISNFQNKVHLTMETLGFGNLRDDSFWYDVPRH